MDERRTYEEWIGELELQGIFLDGISADLDRMVLQEMGRDSELRIVTKHSSKVQVLGSDGLVVKVQFRVSAKADGVRRAMAKIAVDFDVLVMGAIEVPEEFEQRFKDNMVHISWPYLRELVESIAMRSALPIPVAPLMKSKDVKE